MAASADLALADVASVAGAAASAGALASVLAGAGVGAAGGVPDGDSGDLPGVGIRIGIPTGMAALVGVGIATRIMAHPTTT